MNRFIVGTICAVVTASIVALNIAQWRSVAPQLRVARAAQDIQVPAMQTFSAQKESAALNNMLLDAESRYPGHVSAVAIHITTGARGSVVADAPLISASLYKLYVAYGIYQKIDAGELQLTSPVKAVGKTVGVCLDIMITVSDNDCGEALGDIVGWKKLDDQLKSIGLTATKTDNYNKAGSVVSEKLTSASDVGAFLQQLYQKRLLSVKSTDAFIKLLQNQKRNKFLSKGFPAGTPFAHKVGELYDLVHDAGVVATPSGDYIIVAMTHNWQAPLAQSPAAFTALAKAVWEHASSDAARQ